MNAYDCIEQMETDIFGMAEVNIGWCNIKHRDKDFWAGRKHRNPHLYITILI